jgi:hypothetical protein
VVAPVPPKRFCPELRSAVVVETVFAALDEVMLTVELPDPEVLADPEDGP